MSLRVHFHYDDLPFVRACGPMTVRRLQREAARRAGLTVVEDEREPYDVLHANTISPFAPGLFARAREKGAVVIAHGHTTAEDMAKSFTLSNLWSLGAKPHLRRVYDSADAVIVPSQYTKGLIEAYGVRRPIDVISNGIEFEKLAVAEELAARRSRFRSRLRAGPQRFIACGVGLVLERKGIRDFIDAARALQNDLFIWGGELPSPLISLSPLLRLAIHGAPANCRMLGYVDDVRDVFAAADAFAFPSLEENQGIVTLEAAACGLPLVVRDIPVYRGWLKHGENALLFNEAAGLSAHIRTLAADAKLRGRLGEAARQMAFEHRIEKVGSELARVYERALSQKKSAGFAA